MHFCRVHAMHQSVTSESATHTAAATVAGESLVGSAGHYIVFGALHAPYRVSRITEARATSGTWIPDSGEIGIHFTQVAVPSVIDGIL